MNLLISEQKIVTNLVIYSLKSNAFYRSDCRLIHSKNCFQRNVIKSNPFLSTRRQNLCPKRGINFGNIRTFWRIIRLKDRGVEHNFRKDRIDHKSNVLVYKAEVNRICSLGGIFFPLVTIASCIGAKLWMLLDDNPDYIDPHFKPGFIEKYFYEIMIIVSIFHISLSKRYVLRMYFNKDNNMFRVSTWRWYLPFRTHTVDYKPGSASEAKWFKDNILIDTMFGNAIIENKRYFISEEHFTFPIYYNILFGFSPPEALKEFGLHLDVDHNQIAEKIIKQRSKEIVSNF